MVGRLAFLVNGEHVIAKGKARCLLSLLPEEHWSLKVFLLLEVQVCVVVVVVMQAVR